MIDPDLKPFYVLKRMSDELERHEGAFVSVTEAIKGELTVNYHNRPSRSITVSSEDGLTRQIGVYTVLRDTNLPMTDGNWTFLFAIAAWKDTPEGRLHWSTKVRLVETLPRRDPELVAILQDCWSRVLSVRVTDLTATN